MLIVRKALEFLSDLYADGDPDYVETTLGWSVEHQSPAKGLKE